MFPIIFAGKLYKYPQIYFCARVISSWDVNYHKVWCLRTEHFKCNILPTLHECPQSSWWDAWQMYLSHWGHRSAPETSQVCQDIPPQALLHTATEQDRRQSWSSFFWNSDTGHIQYLCQLTGMFPCTDFRWRGRDKHGGKKRQVHKQDIIRASL